MKLRPRGAGIHFQQLGDLVVLVALHVVEHEHFPRPTGQLFHGALDGDPQIGAFRAAGHSIEQSLVVVVALARDAQGLAPAQHQIDRHPVQPGAEARLAGKGVELLPDPDKDLLHRIVRLRRIEQPSREAVHPRHVPFIEPLEGGVIARGCKGDIVPIEIGVGHGTLSLQGKASSRGNAPSLGGLETWGV